MSTKCECKECGKCPSIKDLKHGDVCRAKCGAPARYWREGICLFISSMSNDLCSDEAVMSQGGEEEFPLPTNQHLEGFSVGWTAHALKKNT